MQLADEVEPAAPCRVCAAPAPGYFEVWGLHLCPTCDADWRNAPGLTAGEVADAVGWEVVPMANECQRRTLAWAKARRASLKVAP